MTKYLYLAAAMMSATAACGGDGGGGGSGPLSTAAATDLCADLCVREIECGDDDMQADCERDCIEDFPAGVVRSDAANAIAECELALACNADDDVCLAECSPTGEHESMESACRAKVVECGGTQQVADQQCETTPSANGERGFLCILTPAVMGELQDCYDLPCEDVQACLEALGDRYDL